jgi:transposase
VAATKHGRCWHRWVVERSFAWLTGYRRLTLRLGLETDRVEAQCQRPYRGEQPSDP